MDPWASIYKHTVSKCKPGLWECMLCMYVKTATPGISAVKLILVGQPLGRFALSLHIVPTSEGCCEDKCFDMCSREKHFCLVFIS